MSAGPLVLHLCQDAHVEASSMHEMHLAHRADANTGTGHACDAGDDSDSNSPSDPSMLCCTYTATPLAESAALTPAKVSSVDIAVSAALVSEAATHYVPQDDLPGPLDHGPPALSLRPHLTFSVLLI